MPTDADHHAATIGVYEARATDWEQRRPPALGDVRRFCGVVDSTELAGPVVDLGCGPGWHLPELPTGTIAADAAASMLDAVPRHSPSSPRVRTDLRALPFGRGSLGAVWANKSYVHLHRDLVPLALWDLHRALAVDAPVHLGLFGGDETHVSLSDDAFPGRWFNGWPVDLLGTVLSGAGFTDISIDTRVRDDEVAFHAVTMRRARTLADTVGPGMRMLLVGLNPSLVAADTGVGFFRAGNRAWPALLASGLATADRDPRRLLIDDGIGMTDLVKRATARANELDDAEFRDGLDRLEQLCAWLQPGVVVVLGVTGWRAATREKAVLGLQQRTLGGRPVYVMPNPSGINAHTSVDDLVDHLHAATSAAGSARPVGQVPDSRT